jgi:hypothetical protein
VLRQKYGDNVRMVPIGESKSIISSVLGRTSIGSHGSNMLGALPEQTMAAIEERAIWARFGL